MTREEIIRNLKYTMEKHKNDTVDTFDTNVSVMCKDILEYLEQEPILDKIRAELHANAEYHDDGDCYLRDEWIDEIFNKYKIESEEV